MAEQEHLTHIFALLLAFVSGLAELGFALCLFCCSSSS